MSIRGLKKKKQQKTFKVKVITMEAETEFSCEMDWKGKDLFDSVCRHLALRETWFFGLQFVASGTDTWLKLEKKILQQHVPKEDPVRFCFMTKFYPENVADELFQEVTQHLFFLQVKKQILDEEIICSPEASVLLASYAVQAKYGDYNPNIHQPGFLSQDELLPQRVLQQYQMTTEMWQEKITAVHAGHRGISRDEAEMNYLKIAQDLDMYGVNYFPITLVKNDSDILLGVDAKGIHIYGKNNKISPLESFKWGDIRNISYDDKKLKLIPIDKKAEAFKFYSKEHKVNKLILHLCIGNHNLFLTKRKVDSTEIQEMKAQAKEEKTRRKKEHHRLLMEKELREEAERAKEELERRLFELEEESRQTNEALILSNEAAELLAEKVQIAEDEAKILAQEAVEARYELQRLEMTVLKSKDEMRMMEKKMRESDLITMKLLKESDRRAKEAELLEQDLHKAREAERLAKQRLLERGSFSQTPAKVLQQDTSEGGYDNKMLWQNLDTEYKRLSLEIEKERIEYLEKSKQLENQLNELKLEIQVLKQQDRQLNAFSLYNSDFGCKYNLHDTLLMQTCQKEPTSPYCIPPVYSVSTVRSCPTPERDAYPHSIRMSHTLPNYTTGRETRQNARKHTSDPSSCQALDHLNFTPTSIESDHAARGQNYSPHTFFAP
ncbi:PREDICTED: merlin-like [Nanorana parkeri]|uniref:merlin-like n=1 Tax=Nanorana parkeri TaxID=125878 RepID=UPI00085459E5|nr:PREDICTED: merlin-like [Nanorana parkeri]